MSKEKRVVVRRSPDEWRAILSRFERSGKTHREFCVAEDLAIKTMAHKPNWKIVPDYP